MKTLLIAIACFFSVFGHAGETFSRERVTTFFDVFVCDEKQDLASAGLSSLCGSGSNNPDNPVNPVNPYVPPANPSAPTFKTGLLPVVLVNNSGLPDSEVYVLVTGVSVDSQHQVWGNINTTPGPTFGEATLQNVALPDNSTSFSYPLSSLPTTTGGRVFYIPEIRSCLIWFSMHSKLSMTVVTVPGEIPLLQIVQPNFTNTGDVNYPTNFDIFELTYLLAGSPQVAADATAVSFFSIPLYGYLSNATSASSNTGLYEPRSYIMSRAASTFSQAKSPEINQWNNLFLKSGSNIVRLCSPGKAMAASLFDPNYLDNAVSYGYSYIQDIWTGIASFYRLNPMSLTVTVTSPATATYNYTGKVVGGQFQFTSSDGGPPVTFPVPTTSPTPTGTTSFDIFSAINFITPLPVAGTAADAVSKLVQEAIIAGLVPTTNTLSLSYLSSNQANFYKVNSNLSSAGRNSGPWFDLYSKALHSLGSIYTYGFDEPLWPQVLLGAPFIDGSTYLGITIGNVD